MQVYTVNTRMKHVRYTIYPTLTRVDFCCARTTAGRQDAADAVRARAGAENGGTPVRRGVAPPPVFVLNSGLLS